MTTRQLTQEEIDIAPQWATHYRSDGQQILYESTDFWCRYIIQLGCFEGTGKLRHKSKLTLCTPIPRKVTIEVK